MQSLGGGGGAGGGGKSICRGYIIYFNRARRRAENLNCLTCLYTIELK